MKHIPTYVGIGINVQEQPTPAQAIMDAERNAAVQAAVQSLLPREHLAVSSWFGIDHDPAANVSAVGKLIGSDSRGATMVILRGIRRLVKPLAWLKPG